MKQLYDPCGHREQEVAKVQHRVEVAGEQNDLPERSPCGGYYCSEEHGHIDCQDKFPRVNRCAACGRFINVGRIYCDNCHDCEDDNPEPGTDYTGT